MLWYSEWKMCGPMSTTSPVTGSRQQLARPPSLFERSTTVTAIPWSASATAQARPASPPPITAT